MSSIISSASSTFAAAIPTGTISALIGQPPNTTTDYYIAKYLLLVFGKTTDPALGAFIPPARPANYVLEDRGPGILASMSVAIAVMIIVTGLRLGVRVFNRGLTAGWDDLFIIPGVILAIAWPALQICCVVYGGAGKHIYDVTYEEYGAFKKFANIDKMMFFLAVGFIKVSICIFNRRLTSLTSKAWIIFNNCFLILLFAYIMIALFWNIVQCDPPYAGWNPVRIAKEGRRPVCTSDTIVGSSLSVIHVIMDFGLLSVPLIVLWKVRMGWGTRLRLYLVFSIGGMSAIGSIMRQIEQESLLKKNDLLWNFKALQDWTLVDLTFGVVAASLPVLSAFIPKKWKSVNDSRGTPGYGSNGPKNNLNGHSAYIRSTRRTSISGKRERLNSEEHIVRTDEIELTYTSKADFDREMNSTSTSSNSSLGRKQSKNHGEIMEYRRNDIKELSPQGHQTTWSGRAQ